MAGGGGTVPPLISCWAVPAAAAASGSWIADVAVTPKCGVLAACSSSSLLVSRRAVSAAASATGSGAADTAVTPKLSVPVAGSMCPASAACRSCASVYGCPSTSTPHVSCTTGSRTGTDGEIFCYCPPVIIRTSDELPSCWLPMPGENSRSRASWLCGSALPSSLWRGVTNSGDTTVNLAGPLTAAAPVSSGHTPAVPDIQVGSTTITLHRCNLERSCPWRLLLQKQQQLSGRRQH